LYDAAYANITSHHGNSITSERERQKYVSWPGGTRCDELTVKNHDIIYRAGFTVVGALALLKCGGPCQ
jgi:hypothetical protein